MFILNVGGGYVREENNRFQIVTDQNQATHYESSRDALFAAALIEGATVEPTN